MRTRAMGTAPPVRIIRIVMATINSMRVRPEPRFLTEVNNGNSRGSLLFYRDHGLSGLHRQRILTGVARPRARDIQHRLASAFGHKGQREHDSLPRHPARARRTGRVHDDQSLLLIRTAYQSDRLSVLLEKLAGRHIHELKR